MATIYQGSILVPDLSVAESIFLAHEPRRGPLLDLDKMYRDSAALLARLGHESIPVRAKVGKPSRPAQQIVSIARALSGNVRLLVMDEPSAILDEAEINTLFDVVRRLTAEGVGVVYISHRLDEIGASATASPSSPTAARRRAVCLRRRRPASWSSSWSVGSIQLYPDRAVGTDRLLLEVRDARRLPAVRGVSLEGERG